MRYELSQTAVSTEPITQSVLQCLARLQQKRQLDDDAHDLQQKENAPAQCGNRAGT
jgi:hypothetical protein